MILNTSSVTDSHYQLIQATGIYMTSAIARYSCDGARVLVEYEDAALAKCQPCADAVAQAVNAGVVPMTAVQARAYLKDPTNGFECAPTTEE